MIKLEGAPTLERWQHDAQVLMHGDTLNITGWRNIHGKPDSFCDYISIAVRKGDSWDFKVWEATTRPGLSMLLKPVNPKGAAILVPDYYHLAYKLGLHKGLPALVQAKPVKVYRDSNKDSAFDDETATLEQGMFGINIHRAGTLSFIVDKWSAGCQVFKRAFEFEEFLNICKKSGQEYFSYNLVEFEHEL